MPAPTQEFSVAIVMGVTKNVAVLSFPAFPKGGTLIVLQPAWMGEEPSLSGYAAEIQPPGSRYTYSNLGFGVLGESVARISGQRFSDFLVNEVFAPLALKIALKGRSRGGPV